MAVPLEEGETLRPGVPVPLFELSGYFGMLSLESWDYVPAPAGRQFLLSKPSASAAAPSPIHVIVNWTGLVAR